MGGQKMGNYNEKQILKKEPISSEELEEISGGRIPEKSMERAIELAKQIAAHFRSIGIPDNSRETVWKYVDMFWYLPMINPYSEKGIAGLYYPLSNFTITKDDVVDLVQKYV